MIRHDMENLAALPPLPRVSQFFDSRPAAGKN